MKIKLIKISRFLTVLRPITIVLIFIPIIIGYRHFKPYVITIWEFFCLISYFIQKYVIKRYKIVGYIEFNEDFIMIEDQEINKDIHLSEISNVSIYYYGYKGQPTKGTLTPYYNLSFDEGIGEIRIMQVEGLKIRLFYLSENKEDYDRLERLINSYKEKGLSIYLFN